MKRRVLLSLSLFVVSFGFTSLHSVMATDLLIRNISPSCIVKVGELLKLKVIVNNTLNTGGGPFDSTNTRLHSRFPTCNGGRFSCRQPGSFSVLRQVRDGASAFYDSEAIPYRRSLLRNKETQFSTWDGNTLITDLGTIDAGEEAFVEVFFTFKEEGLTTLEFAIEGDLTDPNPNNNTVSIDIMVIPTEKKLLYPWVSNNEGQFESILIANNYGDSEAQVTLSAQRAEGNAEVVERTIPAGGQLRENAASLFPELGSGSGYTVMLTSTTTTLAGGWVTYNLRTQTARSPSQGVAIDITGIAAPNAPNQGGDMMFNFLPTTESFISAPVLVNLSPEPANIVLRFYNQAGSMILEDRDSIVGLAPMRPFAVVANTLLPENSGDVYLVATSETGIMTGVSFVFNAAGEPSIGNVTGLGDFISPE